MSCPACVSHLRISGMAGRRAGPKSAAPAYLLAGCKYASVAASLAGPSLVSAIMQRANKLRVRVAQRRTAMSCLLCIGRKEEEAREKKTLEKSRPCSQ